MKSTTRVVCNVYLSPSAADALKTVVYVSKQIEVFIYT